MYKIWGIKYDTIYFDNQIWWKIFINKKPFYWEGDWWFDLNSKLLKKAIEEEINRFIIIIGNKKYFMRVPDKIDLREKKKRKEYNMQASLFQNSKSSLIYLFKISSLKKA